MGHLLKSYVGVVKTVWVFLKNLHLLMVNIFLKFNLHGVRDIFIEPPS